MPRSARCGWSARLVRAKTARAEPNSNPEAGSGTLAGGEPGGVGVGCFGEGYPPSGGSEETAGTTNPMGLGRSPAGPSGRTAGGTSPTGSGASPPEPSEKAAGAAGAGPADDGSLSSDQLPHTSGRTRAYVLPCAAARQTVAPRGAQSGHRLTSATTSGRTRLLPKVIRAMCSPSPIRRRMQRPAAYRRCCSCKIWRGIPRAANRSRAPASVP